MKKITPVLIGTFILGILLYIGFVKKENINAIWLILMALGSYYLGYRYYSRFITKKVFGLSNDNITPAHRLSNGLDYVPTNKWVVFGHHFAAIAGAGPLVGPVLAAQLGYLPSTLWIIFGSIFAGAVQDLVILIISVRKDGKSLGDIVKDEIGNVAGIITLFSIFTILVILIAVLSLVVVKALSSSAWGTFTILATIFIALIMGVIIKLVGKKGVLIASIFGFIALIFGIVIGRYIALDPSWSKLFIFSETELAIGIIGYGFIASVLPVWLLLAPRDYLSTFLKVGTIGILAIGIFFVLPEIKMPSLTTFIDGNGPVWKGEIFPFLFITIACGALSGFHSLVSSGTTPKLINKEKDVRFIGYGSMVVESFVSLMALIAAVTMDPGVYFAINSPASEIGNTVVEAAQKISSWGFPITSETIQNITTAIEEKTILSRTGGAPSLAVGMAFMFSSVFGESLISFFYHFIILFEAIFILTTIDAGTRIGRYLFQDLVGLFYKPMKDYGAFIPMVVSTLITVSLWGYFLYAGVIDPYGGIKTLWPLFGISNQLLASIALMIGTIYLLNRGKYYYSLITAIPLVFVTFNTIYAAFIKMFSSSPDLGFLSHANMLAEAVKNGNIPLAIPNIKTANQVILNDYIDEFVTGIYVALVLLILVIGVFKGINVIRNKKIINS